MIIKLGRAVNLVTTLVHKHKLLLSLYFCRVQVGKRWTKTFKNCLNILKFHNVIWENSSEKCHSQWPDNH